MKKSLKIALILGIVISIGMGIIKYKTVPCPSGALFLPLLIAGFVASFAAMRGTNSRLGAIGLALVSVFIGTLIGQYIGIYLILPETLRIFAETSTGYIVEVSIIGVGIAFLPALIGALIGKRVLGGSGR